MHTKTYSLDGPSPEPGSWGGWDGGVGVGWGGGEPSQRPGPGPGPCDFVCIYEYGMVSDKSGVGSNKSGSWSKNENRNGYTNVLNRLGMPGVGGLSATECGRPEVLAPKQKTGG